MESVVASSAGSAGLAAAAGARQALKVATEITKALDAHKRHCDQKSKELALRFPEDTGELNIAVEIKSGFWGGKVHFAVPNVINVSVHSFPAFKSEDQAITKSGSEFVLDPSQLPKDIQTILLRFEYRLEEPRFLESLVQRNGQLDPRSHEDRQVDSYWLTAQLRHLSTLAAFFQRLELRGLECRVDVGVHEEIKTKMPQGFVSAVRRQAEFGLSRDRERTLRLRRDQLRDFRFAGKTDDIVQRLREVFLPSRFKKYLEVQDPFHFWSCEQGRQMFEIPFVQLPQVMTVVSRTDLTLSDPARNGKLVYRKADVRTELEKVFA